MSVPATDPVDIHNWRRLEARLTTSGQPSEAQLEALRAIGVSHVVNLALHSHEKALPDEAASVAALGMAYIHIPVEFGAPTEADFARFSDVMAGLADATVHVHCIVNARVSAFLYRYRRDVIGMDEAEARAAMETIWSPTGVWADFIAMPAGTATVGDATALRVRTATAADLAALHPVIERAYRGDSARAGWTHEADLLDGARTDLATLAAIVASPTDRLLVAIRDGATIGCVQISDRGDGLAYLGLLCIDPLLQAAGLGRLLIAEAETQARAAFGAIRIEMTVIDSRAELIAYYQRRGYRLTDELRPFPIALDPPLAMVVLEKPLA